MTIDEFKQTRDYKDICYFIKHVPWVGSRISVLSELGYKVVPKPITTDKEDSLSAIDKMNDKIYVQVTKKIKGKKFAWFVKI